MEKPKRMAFILLNFPKDSETLLKVISALSKFGSLLLGSLYIPAPENKGLIFGIVVKANTDQLGALTGSLGKISGVKIKSAVLPIE